MGAIESSGSSIDVDHVSRWKIQWCWVDNEAFVVVASWPEWPSSSLQDDFCTHLLLQLSDIPRTLQWLHLLAHVTHDQAVYCLGKTFVQNALLHLIRS